MKYSIKLLTILGGISVLIAGSGLVSAKASKKKKNKELGNVFYVYTDRGSRLNHYAPSGWMGDYGDLKLNQGWTKNVRKPDLKKGKGADSKQNTCIQIKYTAERKQGAGWD